MRCPRPWKRGGRGAGNSSGDGHDAHHQLQPIPDATSRTSLPCDASSGASFCGLAPACSCGARRASICETMNAWHDVVVDGGDHDGAPRCHTTMAIAHSTNRSQRLRPTMMTRQN